MASSSELMASIAIGATAGVAEVTANQPFIYFKNCLQTGKPISLNPLVLYRGYFVNISTLGPITAFQVAASEVIYKSAFARYAPKGDGNTPPPKPLLHMGISSMIAGSLSGILSGPSETIILQQQQTGKAALPTLQSMLKEYGVRSVFRGTPFAMMRDGGFTAGFMALGPYFSTTLEQHGYSEMISRVGGGILAGVIAAVVTHPFDTLKTKYQNDFRKTLYPSFRHVLKDGSVFQGLSARGTRVIIGTCIISNLTDILTKKYEAYVNKQAGASYKSNV